MNNLSIAIIDDDQVFIKQIKGALQALNMIDIDVYRDELIYTFNGKKYDIVFISCALNDFECFVQKRKNNDKLFIYMVSSSLLNEGLKSNAFRIIVKTKLKLELPNVLQTAIDYIENTYIMIYTEGRNYSINMNNVLIIFSENHYLSFVLEDRTLRTRSSFRDIEKFLLFNDFVRAKSGCFINLDYVVSYDRRMVKLGNNMHVYLSRNGYKELLKNKIVYKR